MNNMLYYVVIDPSSARKMYIAAPDSETAEEMVNEVYGATRILYITYNEHPIPSSCMTPPKGMNAKQWYMFSDSPYKIPYYKRVDILDYLIETV